VNILKQMWYGALEKIFDFAFGLMLRSRRTLLPPKPIVWHDPRPYRFWTVEVLRDKFADSQSRDVHPDDREERVVQCALMLEEILDRHGVKSRMPQSNVHN